MMKTALEQTTKAVASIENGPWGGPMDQDASAWQCEYIPCDAYLLAPDHPHIRKMAMAEDLVPTGLLDIRLELSGLTEKVLQKMVVRISVRDVFGMSQYVAQGKAESFLVCRPENGLRGMHMTLPIESDALAKLECNGTNSFYLVLKDEEGHTLDHLLGELRVSRC